MLMLTEAEFNQIINQKNEEIEKYKKLIAQLTHSYEKEIINKQNYYENMIALMPGHVYWLDRNNVYLGCNDLQAQHTGLASRKDIVGKKNSDMIWKDQAKELDYINLKVMETGESYTVEEYAELVNGAAFFLTQKVPLHNQDGEIIGLLGISVDITDRKKMENDLQIAKEKAELANRAKSEFISNMSHDIRTPLTGIIGATQILSESFTDAKNVGLINMILVSSRRLMNLLNNVMDMISVDNINESDINLRALNLNELLTGIYELESPSALAKNLDLSLNIESTVPQFVITDATKLERILLNLIGNSIKFTVKGYIQIDVKLLNLTNNEATIEFRIKDSGIGIPQEQLEQIFNRFYRANPSFTGRHSGQGIGLYIVKKYVELLNGQIDFFSQLGQGTEFIISLKMQVCEEVPQEVKSQFIQELFPHDANTHHPDFNKQSAQAILIIEDDPIAQTLLQTLFQRENTTVEIANNGELALTLAKKYHYDLIVTDLGLPQLSGEEFTAAYRYWEKISNKLLPTTIIGLTAYADDVIKANCIYAGMNAIFIKPLDIDLATQILSKLKKENNLMKKSYRKTSINSDDLPESDDTLFHLNHYPLFEKQAAIEIVGSDAMLFKLIRILIEENIPSQLYIIESAHKHQDWETIRKAIHTLKGSSIYCGAIKMKYACQNFENYLQSGQTKHKEDLYQQLLTVIDETTTHLSNVISSL